MRSTTFIRCVGTVALSLGIVACLSDPGGGGEETGGAGAGVTGGTDGLGGISGTGGTSGTGALTGGTTSSGGVVGTGGTVSTGGALSTGGVAGTDVTGGSGGTDSGGTGGGGTTSTGGALSTGGTGGSVTGGMGGMATGGMGGYPGGRAGAGNTGGTAGAVAGTGGTGGTGSGTCTKGQTKGNQVVVIGESFIAASHQITQQIETRAKAAGSLAQSERYIDNSVSGTTLANNQIGSQFDKAATAAGVIKYVLMDGGGNDCLINNNGSAALTAATQLFQRMTSKQVEKVVYFFYPDPVGSNFASLKSCLDTLRPQMKAICDGLTSPKCYWLDLRPTWNGHAEYTSDGIHPTAAGSKATGDVIWETMVQNCVAQ